MCIFFVLQVAAHLKAKNDTLFQCGNALFNSIRDSYANKPRLYSAAKREIYERQKTEKQKEEDNEARWLGLYRNAAHAHKVLTSINLEEAVFNGTASFSCRDDRMHREHEFRRIFKRELPPDNPPCACVRCKRKEQKEKRLAAKKAKSSASVPKPTASSSSAAVPKASSSSSTPVSKQLEPQKKTETKTEATPAQSNSILSPPPPPVAVPAGPAPPVFLDIPIPPPARAIPLAGAVVVANPVPEPEPEPTSARTRRKTQRLQESEMMEEEIKQQRERRRSESRSKPSLSVSSRPTRKPRVPGQYLHDTEESDDSKPSLANGNDPVSGAESHSEQEQRQQHTRKRKEREEEEAETEKMVIVKRRSRKRGSPRLTVRKRRRSESKHGTVRASRAKKEEKMDETEDDKECEGGCNWKYKSIEKRKSPKFAKYHGMRKFYCSGCERHKWETPLYV